MASGPIHSCTRVNSPASNRFQAAVSISMTQPDRPLFTEDTGTRDATWVQAALSGDSDAFGRLVAAYQRVAVSTAYRLLGNSDDAAETAQEAFLRAYRGEPRTRRTLEARRKSPRSPPTARPKDTSFNRRWTPPWRRCRRSSV